MSHHSDDLPPELQRGIRDAMRALGQPLGETGKFPRGLLTPEDEGEIRLAISATPGGEVVMDFGKPVVWIGFTKDQALQVAETLRKHAETL